MVQNGEVAIQPYIVHIPVNVHQLGTVEMREEIQSQIDAHHYTDYESNDRIRTYLERYPVVYVIHTDQQNPRNTSANQSQYTVYVGETNNIISRTRQHVQQDPKTRSDWKKIAATPEAMQYVIGSEYFNKSLTLDIENRLMHYMSSSDSVIKLNNRRTNAQGEYYTHTLFDSLFHDIWLELHQENPDLFPAEQIILDSALFKASPFHQLSDDQKEAENTILNLLSEIELNNTVEPTLILVSGAAGTGKTVLLSHLFYRILNEYDSDEVDDDDEETEDSSRENALSAYILVNHDEQLHVYNQIATKLGLQKKRGQIVLKPSSFIKQFSEQEVRGRQSREYPTIVEEADGTRHYIPQGKADIVLIDEAHLLNTQGNQAYTGTNMLADILRRAKVVVAVFDPSQILQSAQRWKDADLNQLFSSETGESVESVEEVNNDSVQPALFDASTVKNESMFYHAALEDVPFRRGAIELTQQFRIAAQEPTVKWLDQFIHEGIIGEIPRDTGELNPRANERGEKKWITEPYDLRVFDSPVALMQAIRRKAQEKADGADGKGLSRVLATYDWDYKRAKPNPDTEEFGSQWSVEMFRVDEEWHLGEPDEHTRGFDANDDDYFYYPWNYEIDDTDEEKAAQKMGELAWAEKPHTIDEIGSTYTIQGFDLNYAGVIIGPSVKFNEKTQRIEFDARASKNSRAKSVRYETDFSEENLRNELNVLLTRGVHGLYIFAADSALRKELLKQQAARK